MYFCYLRPCWRNLWDWDWPFYTGFLHRPAQAKRIICRGTTIQWELHIAARILSVQYCVNHQMLVSRTDIFDMVHMVAPASSYARAPLAHCFALVAKPLRPISSQIQCIQVSEPVHQNLLSKRRVLMSSHAIRCWWFWNWFDCNFPDAIQEPKLRKNFGKIWQIQRGTLNFAAKLKSSVCRMQVFSCVLQFFAVGVPDLSGLMKHDLTILQFRFGGSEMQSDGVAVPCRSQTGVRNLFCSFVYLSAAQIVRIGLTLFYALLNRRHPTRFLKNWFCL